MLNTAIMSIYDSPENRSLQSAIFNADAIALTPPPLTASLVQALSNGSFLVSSASSRGLLKTEYSLIPEGFFILSANAHVDSVAPL